MSDEKKVVDSETVIETLEADISGKSSKKDTAKKSGKAEKKSGKISEFFKGLKSDIKKINWPTFKMVLKSTGVVLAVVAILGVLIWVLDLAFGFVFTDGVNFIIDKIVGGTSTTEAASLFM